MRTRMLLFVVAVTAALVGHPAYAHGPHHRGSPYAALDLTADQQKQLSELRAALDQKLVPLRNEMSTQSTELRRLWAAPTPDRKAIQEKQGQLDQIRKQMQDARTDHRLAALKVLTPAQREKLQAAGDAWGGPGAGRGSCGGGPCGYGAGGGRGGWCGGGPGAGCGGGPGGGCDGNGPGRGPAL